MGWLTRPRAPIDPNLPFMERLKLTIHRKRWPLGPTGRWLMGCIYVAVPFTLAVGGIKIVSHRAQIKLDPLMEEKYNLRQQQRGNLPRDHPDFNRTNSVLNDQLSKNLGIAPPTAAAAAAAATATAAASNSTTATAAPAVAKKAKRTSPQPAASGSITPAPAAPTSHA